MSQDADGRIEMNRYKLTVHGADDTTRVIRYNESATLREAVSFLTRTVAEVEALGTFGEICTLCGACCRRPNVLVTAHEIFTLARHLGIPDAQFVDEYLEPAPTFNRDEGTLRLRDGACPFLETSVDGRTTRCSVHDIRPFTCRSFVPISPMCIKAPEFLVEHLETLELGQGKLQVTVEGGVKQVLDATIPPLREPVEALAQALASDLGPREDKIGRFMDGLEKLLSNIRSDYDQHQVRGPLWQTFTEARELVSDLTRIVDLRSAQVTDMSPNVERLEKIWATVRELERLLIPAGGLAQVSEPEASEEAALETPESQDPPLADAPAGAAEHPAPPVLQSFTLYPEVLVAAYEWRGYEGTLPFTLNATPALLEAVHTFTESLVKWDTPELGQALQETKPPCFLCGECCGFYTVEIRPSDIERLAWNLRLPYDEVTQQHTREGRFDWNGGNRAFLKKDIGGRELCTFLELRDDGFYYCKVHPFKPAVCRAYEPTNRLCRYTNDQKYWPRLVRNIIYITVLDTRVEVLTHRLSLQGKPALVLDLAHRAWCQETADRVKREVRRLMDAQAQRVLEAERTAAADATARPAPESPRRGAPAPAAPA